MKTFLSLLCLLAAVSSARAGIFGGGKPDAKAALETLAGLSPELLDVAADQIKDPRAKLLLGALKGGEKNAAAPGYPRAVTNFYERLPDGTSRLITNSIVPVLTFPPITLAPIVAQAAPPIVPQVLSTPDAVLTSGDKAINPVPVGTNSVKQSDDSFINGTP